MAGESRMLFIEGKWVDSASPEFAATMDRMRQASAQTGHDVQRFIGEDSAQAMSQLGEKGEKARMMMTMLGGQMGAVGGQATYMATQVSFMLGKFRLWEVVLMGVVGAVGGLIYAVTRETEAEKAWREAAEEHEKQLKNIKEKTEDLIISEKKRMLGLENERQYQEHLARERIKTAERTLAAHARAWEIMKKEEIEGTRKISAEEHIRITRQRDELRQRVQDQKNAYAELRAAGKAFFDWEVRQAENEEKLEAARLAAKGARPKGTTAGEGEGLALDWDQAAEDREIAEAAKQAALDYAKAWEDRQWAIYDARREWETEEEREQEAHLWRLYNLRERHAKMQIELARKASEEEAQERKRAIEQGIGLMESALSTGASLAKIYDMFGESTAKSEKERAVAIGKRMAFENTIAALTETAKSVGAFATYDFWGGAQHALAASLHWAAAGKAAASPAAAGGYSADSGASVSARESAQSGGWWRDEQRSEGVTIIIQGDVLEGAATGRKIRKALEDYDNFKNPGRYRSRVI